jgi:hypothetical protein
MVAGIVASLVFWQTGVAALADPPSAEWFAWRPVWYLVCTAVLLVLVRLVRWAERPLPVTSGGPATSVARVGAVVLGVAAACGAMILLGVSGLGAGPPAQPVAILAVFVLGSAMIMGASGLTPTIGRLLRSSSRAPGAALR